MAYKTIIVIFGNMAAGKTTVANIFGEQTKGKVINFADPVKMVAKNMVGIPLEVSHGTQEDKATFTKYGRTAREHLQRIGTEFGRDGVSKTVWVDRFLDVAVESMSGMLNPSVIAGDGRFPDEELIYLRGEAKKRGIKVLGIVIRRPSITSKSGHPSESVIANTDDATFDGVILNTGTIEDLKDKVAKIVGMELLTPVEQNPITRGDGYIRTYSGIKFWPLDPDPKDVLLADIARGLAGEIRWSGMARKHINVAWHSNLVRKLAMVIATAEDRSLVGLYAQLHDAQEAYIKDIPKPVKSLLPGYDEASDKLDSAIFTHFGLAPCMPDDIRGIVDKCDQWAAAIEARRWHYLTESEMPEYPPEDVAVKAGVSDLRPPNADKDEEEFLENTTFLLSVVGSSMERV